ncbi:MAG: fasciclin domain-containing protein, partial [Gammaproteobacteria bacterium]|nr:fasciclin domain-containing protein [Gammaproteobacteria bacterium]MBU1444422.1 fasciclin domain-containing protein [Gammaproteobacteria bacterium]
FAALPAGTVDTLLQPQNKPTLTKVLTYHVVPGRVDAQALMSMIAAGGGKAMLKTASGGTLTATMSGGKVMITDAKGGTATVTIANVYQSNGVIHVVDKVLLPG